MKTKRRQSTRRKKNNNKLLSWLVGLCIVVGGGIMQMQWMNRTSAPRLKLRLSEVPCFYCGGEATVRNSVDPSKTDECGICYGVGRRRILSPNENREICPACVGMGRLPDDFNSGTTCRTCNGWGVVMLTTYQESEPIVTEPGDLEQVAPVPADATNHEPSAEEKFAPVTPPVTNSASDFRMRI